MDGEDCITYSLGFQVIIILLFGSSFENDGLNGHSFYLLIKRLLKSAQFMWHNFVFYFNMGLVKCVIIWVIAFLTRLCDLCVYVRSSIVPKMCIKYLISG